MPKNIHHLTIGGQQQAAGGGGGGGTSTGSSPSTSHTTPVASGGSTVTSASSTSSSVAGTGGTAAVVVVDPALGALHRNDSKKFLDNKSQSVSSKPRPPPLNVTGTTGTTTLQQNTASTNPSNPVPAVVSHDPLSNGLVSGAFKSGASNQNRNEPSQTVGGGGGGGGSGGGGSSGGGQPTAAVAGTKLTNEQLKRQIDSTDCTDEQKANIHKFLDLREQIGELNDEALNVEGELGSGNGGVVLKCRHRKLDIVMAKKVIEKFT